MRDSRAISPEAHPQTKEDPIMYSSRCFAVTFMASLLFFSTSAAALDPEPQCQKGRYNAWAKYVRCEQKVTGGLVATGNVTSFQRAVWRCVAKYTNTWARLQAQATGTGSSCDAPRFSVGSGMVTDHLTGLQWEQKTDDGSVHDKDNGYSWSVGGNGFAAANGTVFTSFFATLNSGSCFAGQCDWRLPTRAELQTILLQPFPCPSPCIDQGYSVRRPHLSTGHRRRIPRSPTSRGL